MNGPDLSHVIRFLDVLERMDILTDPDAMIAEKIVTNYMGERVYEK